MQKREFKKEINAEKKPLKKERIFGKPKLISLVVFVREISSMFKSGVPLARALAILSEQMEDKVLKFYIKKVYFELTNKGLSLSRALSQYPKIFPAVLVNLVMAGEKGSSLSETLERAAIYMEKELNIRRAIQSAMTYPMVVLATSVIAVLLMFKFVFPQFIPFFDTLGTELPLPTKILIGISKVTGHPFGVILMVLILGFMIYLAKSYLDTPEGRYNFDSWKLRIPVLGPVLLKTAALNFCRTLSILYSSGIPFTNSMDVLEKSCENRYVKKIVSDAKESVKGGSYLSDFLIKSKVFPPLVNQMIAVGEESGQLSKVLNKVVEFYDAEIEYTMDSLTSLLEPIIIVVLGLVVGFVLLSIMLPLYEVLMKLGG